MYQRTRINQDKDYAINLTGGFHKKLVKQITMVWTYQERFVDPRVKFSLPPFIQCLNYGVTGKVKIPKFILEKTGLKLFDFKAKYFKTGIIIEPKHQHELAILYNVVVDYYQDRAIVGGRDLRYISSLGLDPTQNINPKIIGLLSILKHNGGETDYYALLLPDLKKGLPLVKNYNYCNSCGNYLVNKNWGKHLMSCRKCNSCGCKYTKGDGHEEQCNSRHKYKKELNEPEDEVRRYKCEPEEIKKPSFKHHYFADFETLVPGGKRDYEVYSGAYIPGKKMFKKSFLYYGYRALDNFMNNVIKYTSGIMWFFNGSRFDNFFILRWLLKKKVRIDEKSLLINGNNILSIKFKTRRGWIQLKDLSKFLSGSLKACCASFGLPTDLSKKDFDHEKIKSWEDVYAHKFESNQYQNMDVISLRALYKSFAKTIFKLYKIDPGKYMTITQIAYAAFTSQLSPDIHLYKTTKEEEPIMREMYKGGRVLCGRKMWKSSFYKEVKESKTDWFDPKVPMDTFSMDGDCITQELYNRIDDYLVYADVNSLYPAVQVSTKHPLPPREEGQNWSDLLLTQFPHGRHTITHFGEEVCEEQAKLLAEINSRDKTQKNKWMRSGACVDIVCPKDLSVAFLMTREMDGSVRQDLLDKHQQWYTGPELWEASILGYAITKIYAFCEWETNSSMFQQFVEKTYAIKSAQDSDGPMRACAKALLNGLTGKFGQKNIPKGVVLFLPDKELDRDLIDVTQILDDDGTLLGYYGVEVKEFNYAPFPIELSSFILGHSRIYMSKLLRKMSIERALPTQGPLLEGEEEFRRDFTYDESPFYSDTDSLILHVHSWLKLENELKGDKKLGQLKLEIDGKIISFVCLANKTYSITFVEAKTNRILSITKTKGIPHKGSDRKDGAYNTFDYYGILDRPIKERALMHSSFLDYRRKKNFPSWNFCPESSNITSRAYIFREARKGKENLNDLQIHHICRKIPPPFLPKILKRKWTMECIFGGMTRQLKPGGLEEIFIAPETKSRSLCVTDWWAQEKRKHAEENNPWWSKYGTAYPRGHFMIDDTE